MSQMSFSEIEYSMNRKTTRKQRFLKEMERIMPWERWIAIISPHYHPGEFGRPPKDIGLMLRMFMLQSWYNLSDEGIEDMCCEDLTAKAFLRLAHGERVPDSTTLMKFRHLLEEKGLCKVLFDDVAKCLKRNKMIMQGGTIEDATIINAPSSTKNKEGRRDPEMSQTKKGGQWYFGMKGHVGVDVGSGFIHSLTVTSANVHDVTEAHRLFRKGDHVLYGDSAYSTALRHMEAEGMDVSGIEVRTTGRNGRRPARQDGSGWTKRIEGRIASVRSKVEHVFLLIKRQFGYSKARYRGLAKNLNRLYILAASANMVMVIRSGRTEEFCRG